jgi:acetylornithine/succinyldiaminopimelate/putrescine aminotransferase
MAAWGGSGHGALHTGTFFGNPLGCAAALAALDVIEEEGLCLRALQLGEWLRRALEERLGKRVTVRGAGLLIGLELASGAQALATVHKLLQRGYITVPAGEDARVISLSPPLAIGETVLHGFVECVSAVLGEVGA